MVLEEILALKFKQKNRLRMKRKKMVDAVKTEQQVKISAEIDFLKNFNVFIP